jgi:ferredoxin
MKVKVDEETCIGCGVCVDTCPEVFELADDKAIAKVNEVPKDLVESCKEAADNCPVEAIELKE